MFCIIFLELVIYLSFAYCNSLFLNLGGSSWSFHSQNSSSSLQFFTKSAIVPGCVHSDLFRHNKDKKLSPYYGFNDVNYSWIAKNNWTYSRTFSLSEHFYTQEEQWLIFEGIDTFASISLNGKIVGNTHDMFTTYRFNITNLVQTNFNFLEVSFTSAVSIAEDLASLIPYKIPPECPPNVQNGFCHVNLIRKEQSSFSWDWGPAFATQGIWRPVYVIAFTKFYLQSVTASFLWDQQILLIELKVQTSKTYEANYYGDIKVEISDLNFTKYFYNVHFLRQNGSNVYESNLKLMVENVKYELWWPNGFGFAKLYEIKVYLNSSNESCEKKFKFGFRKVELIQESVTDSKGLTFYFKINNRKIFAKGANWVPADAFHDRVDSSRLENLLESARAANMNMLRVWGGGIYEDDKFYEIADEKGILIWQDLMFACSMYPVTEDFLSNVTQEVEDNIWRLKHHPSIVLWAANNENEAALAKNWYKTSSNYSLYFHDYKTLYIKTLRNLVEKLDAGRPFLTSSPTNGLESEDEGWVAKNPYDVSYGDVHYYNYDDDCLDRSTYPLTRFASEYGFQSWPSLRSLSEVSEPDLDWKINSSWAKHRQHHLHGSQQINQQINRHFPASSSINSTFLFIRTVFLSQVMQALCYESQTEFYLQSRSSLDSNGHGLTMGALYWQLNDIWQAPTWSSLEYDGSWKPLHYFARRFFSSISLIAYKDHNKLFVHLQSSNLNLLQDVLKITIHTFVSFESFLVDQLNVNIKPQSSNLIYRKKIEELLNLKACSTQSNCFISLKLEKNVETPIKYIFPESFKYITDLKEPNLKVSNIDQIEARLFHIQISASKPALFVWIETSTIKGYFSENSFQMTNPTINITFYSWTGRVTVESLLKDISIKSLHDFSSFQNTIWLDDTKVKLVFALVGVVFIILAAFQVAYLVQRSNKSSKPRGSTLNTNLRNSNKQLLEASESQDEESTAFLIKLTSKNDDTSEKTELRFYIV